MPKRKRVQIASTNDWVQLRLLCDWPEQTTYELIRPVVLFGLTPAERAQQSGVSERTVQRKVTLFDRQGLRGLLPPETSAPGRRLPAALREAILDLKAEHPDFRPAELAEICYVRFGRRPSHHTVEQLLTTGPITVKVTRRFPPYAEVADPVERRLAIIRLHSEGWSVSSIAAYLQTNRPRVYDVLRRWIAEGLAGMDDQSRAPKTRVRKVDLKAIAAVHRLQENPELGEFRIHAALKQIGIDLSPRTCGRILALNRQLYGLRGPTAAPHEPKEMPFKATRRHQFWTVDIRFLDMHRLGGGMIYVISILENYSRVILASMVTRSQGLTAYLIVVFAAIRVYGSPEALVSDGGAVFRANEARRIYDALSICKEQIDKSQAWQSYIETAFNVQRRMADWHFAKATTWEKLVASHDRWVADYNVQEHWAHRDRADERWSPGAVLGWVTGQIWAYGDLQQIFATTRFGRRVDASGYVRFRHWRIYGERGLERQRAAVWLGDDTLTVEYAEETLAQYTVAYEPDRRHLKSVTDPRLSATQFQSPQPLLWESAGEEWLLALRRPPPAPQRPLSSATDQKPPVHFVVSSSTRLGLSATHSARIRSPCRGEV